MARAPITSTPYPQSTPLVSPMLGVGPGNSGITGDVEVVKGSDAFTLTIRVHGLPPNSNHVSHIHLGSCEVNGAIDVPLQTLAADANGNATSITSVQKPYQIPPAGWYANVHQGPDLQGDDAKSMACGDLKAA